MDTMTADDIEHRFLIPSGYTVPSLDAVRPQLPRWINFLREHGVTHIPENMLSQDPADARAVNLLCVLANQGALIRDAAREHHLRNITGIRAWKS